MIVFCTKLLDMINNIVVEPNNIYIFSNAVTSRPPTIPGGGPTNLSANKEGVASEGGPSHPTAMNSSEEGAASGGRAQGQLTSLSTSKEGVASGGGPSHLTTNGGGKEGTGNDGVK